MTRKAFRPTLGRVHNSMQYISGTKNNATIRDIEETEDEIEELEGTVKSIERNLINGNGWLVTGNDGHEYKCSCASSLYQLPATTEYGGFLYPKETIKVKFTTNPVLRVNTITEFTSLGENETSLDISKWKHDDAPTTIIAQPKSALSISDGFIEMNYDNSNQIVAEEEGITTEGNSTNINTDSLNINSTNINIGNETFEDILKRQALLTSNEYERYNLDSINNLDMILDRTNNMTQLNIQNELAGYGVIGQIKDQKSTPIITQSQQLVTDGNCVEKVTIDEDGIIYIDYFENPCPEEKRIISSTHNWISPQAQSRNYIKVAVKQNCNNCDNGNNAVMEYINYCPSCKKWNRLTNASTYIRCSCGHKYCQNCGTSLSDSSKRLKTYEDNNISAYGTTCKYCRDELSSGTNKQYVNYCIDCGTWGTLVQDEREEDDISVNILRCTACDEEYCSTCGIDQDKHGITLTDNPVQYTSYKNTFRRLKYIRDGL